MNHSSKIWDRVHEELRCTEQIKSLSVAYMCRALNVFPLGLLSNSNRDLVREELQSVVTDHILRLIQKELEGYSEKIHSRHTKPTPLEEMMYLGTVRGYLYNYCISPETANEVAVSMVLR